MMKTDEARSPGPRPKTDWFLRPVAFSVRTTVVVCLIFGAARYPVEDWTFAGCLIGGLLLVSSTLMSVLLLLTTKWLLAYRRVVFADAGLDVEAVDARAKSQVALTLTVSVLLMLFYFVTTWGVALLATSRLLGSLSLSALPAAVQTWALVSSTVAITGLSFMIGLAFFGYFLAARTAKGSAAVPSWALRLAVIVVRIVGGRPKDGLMGNIPLRIRAN